VFFRHEICGFAGAMTDRPETSAAQNDTEQLTRLLELELAQKRQDWKQTSARAQSIRSAGIAFIFFLVVACVIGGYFVFMRVNEQRAHPPPSSRVDRH